MAPLISEQYNTFPVRNSFYMQSINMQCVMYNGEESCIMKNKNEKKNSQKVYLFFSHICFGLPHSIRDLFHQ